MQKISEEQFERFQRQARNDISLAHRATNISASGLLLGIVVAAGGSMRDALTGIDYSVLNPVVKTGFGIATATAVAYYPVACYLMAREIYRDCRGFNENREERNSEPSLNGE
jgi:hypothetical protein